MLLTPEDDAEIRNLLAAYCLCLDLDDSEGWVALFAEDATYHVDGQTFEGHDGLRRMLSGAPGGLHLGGPPWIEGLGPGQARTRQNLLFVERASGTTRSAVYEDELVKTHEGWRIASRRCRFIVPTGLADHPED